MKKVETINEYIQSFSPDIQKLLGAMREAIRGAAPKASEKISYGMPTFDLHGNLVHFAAFKNHIGFYPAPSGILAFQKELATYHSSKGAIQFPLDAPLPLALAKKIVRFRVKEQNEKAKQKTR